MDFFCIYFDFLNILIAEIFDIFIDNNFTEIFT